MVFGLIAHDGEIDQRDAQPARTQAMAQLIEQRRLADLSRT